MSSSQRWHFLGLRARLTRGELPHRLSLRATARLLLDTKQVQKQRGLLGKPAPSSCRTPNTSDEAHVVHSTARGPGEATVSQMGLGTHGKSRWCWRAPGRGPSAPPVGQEGSHGLHVGRPGLLPEALVCCTRSASSAPLWRSPRAPADRSSATWALRTSAFLATFVSKELGASRCSKAPEHSQCPTQVGGGVTAPAP